MKAQVLRNSVVAERFSPSTGSSRAMAAVLILCQPQNTFSNRSVGRIFQVLPDEIYSNLMIEKESGGKV